MSNQEYYKVIVDNVGILEILQNETFVDSKETYLIGTLNGIVQSLPILLYHSKRIIWHGCLMLHLIMVFTTKPRLQSFHGIGLNILCKRNRTIQNSLANLQGQRSTSFAIPQTHWHTKAPTLLHFFKVKKQRAKHSIYATIFIMHFYIGLSFHSVFFDSTILA
jgi:hypothetical protein